jgi:hypothetical protein
VKAFIREAGHALVKLYPKGVSLFWIAPLIPALVVIPEFLQHIVEIRLGMFESGDAFSASADAPVRWAFGYAKIAGLILATLAAARFWGGHDEGQCWWDWRAITWTTFFLGLLAFGIGALPELLKGRLSATEFEVVAWTLSIATLPSFLMMMAGLTGDRVTSLKAMWVRGWGWLAFIAVMVALAFVPASWLHQMNHHWVMGASNPVLWLFAIGDSIVVGLMATLTGTALGLGYRAFRHSVADAH